MEKTPGSGEGSSGDVSTRFVRVIVFAALGLSSLILNSWADRLVVRIIIDVEWGGYCVFAFAPDLLRLLRVRRRKSGCGSRFDLNSFNRGA